MSRCRFLLRGAQENYEKSDSGLSLPKMYKTISMHCVLVFILSQSIISLYKMFQVQVVNLKIFEYSVFR